MITITDKLIEQGRSDSGGWSKRQLELIDVDWPPSKGWKKKMIGKRIEQKKIDQFIELKDKHL